jgi:Lon-like ATP-dependent protease
MNSDYKENDYLWIRELLDYPMTLEKRLGEFSDTSQIQLPEDPIDCVIFQDRAKWAIRKIAQNKGHILMVGRPGTGKSMLAKMFKEVMSKSMGDYLRPKEVIVAYPGKDRNHIRVAYEKPAKMDKILFDCNSAIEIARSSMDEFNLQDQIQSARNLRHLLPPD